MLKRDLTVSIDGVTRDVPVVVSEPMREQASGWFCRYTIGCPDRPRTCEGWGIDPVQAGYLTLETIGAELYTSAAHAEHRLTWLEPGDGYGFPVPRNLRGDLIGSDRLFLGG